MSLVLVRSFCHIGDRWTNCIRSYRIPAAFDFSMAHVEALKEGAATRWGALLKGWMSSQARFEGVEVDILNDLGQLTQRDQTTAESGPGTGGSSVLPSQVAGLVILPTVVGSPLRSRGIQYLPFVPQQRNGPTGVLTDSGLSALQSAGNLIASPFFDTLFHFWIPTVFRRATLEEFDLRAAVARRGLAQQRRRGAPWPSDPAPIWV